MQNICLIFEKHRIELCVRLEVASFDQGAQRDLLGLLSHQIGKKESMKDTARVG